ncbi:MAG TPA: sulfatase-like hydrolase/transferase [Verrucomicrobiota bacterium]|nr:sulfatase-like hydrolase/transferase [Verrucomicrobiota bacterium]
MSLCASIARAILLVLYVTLFLRVNAAGTPARPSIVCILADDMGYGDVSRLNPKGRIPTPNIDRLAREGLTFTDAHSGSSVCTPTRYGLLTGRYAWRSRLKSGVLGGLSPRLIEPGRMTVASLLRAQGYHTACIGKWHLGMDWVVPEGKQISELSIETPAQVWNVDFSKPIRNGPKAVGFDSFFGISASLDMVPYTYIEDDRVTRVPDRDGDFPWFHGRPRRTRRGPVADGFDACGVLGEFTRRAVQHLEERAAAANRDQPFFLYLALASPHTPILPDPDWQGRSGLNAYADFVMETDASVGRVLDALDAHGLTGHTVVLFAADNGCSPEADLPQLAAAGHHPSGPFRGHKADLFEGGHRVPCLVRWPGRIAAGGEYTHPVFLGDLLATWSDLLGVRLPSDAGEDSVSLLPVWLGEMREPVRDTLVHHSVNGSFAIRQGHWKLLLCPDSGGWSAPRPGSAEAAALPPVQLYDLENDPGEQHNLSAEHPDRVRDLIARLDRLVRDGRSTPGAPQTNNGAVDMWRGRPAFEPGRGTASDLAGKPNIVFILADDLGWTDTGVYGSAYYETPHIDRLAAQGLRLMQYHNAPNCQPTRAALMTGQYSPRTGVYTVGSIDRFNWRSRPLRPVDNVERLPLDRMTVAQALKAAGYATGLFGKWHLGQQGECHPGKRGFDEAIVSMGAHFDFNTQPPVEVPPGAYLADWLTDKATDFIRRHRGGPFFLYLPHFAVHSPHHAKPELVARFKDKPGAGGHRNPTYAAMIASVDQSVGRVMQTLEELNLDGNTVLIFSSDNGGVGGYVREGLEQAGDVTDNAPLRSGKGSLYEGGTRDPFIVRWPGVTPAGSRCDVPAIHVDVFPTLLEIAGAKPPAGQVLDGESLVPLFRNPTASLKRDAIYQHFPGYLGSGGGTWRTTPVGTIQSGDWKLFEFFEDGRLELYDLRNDPGESRNLAREQPDRAREMHARLKAWREAIGASMPTPRSAGR